jgi:hypothetical protein
MTGIRIVAATMLLMLITCGCGSDTATTTPADPAPANVAELTPDQIFEKVMATYQAMETYQSTGTIVIDMDMGGKQMNMQTKFSMLLKKPNLHHITWTQKNMPMPGMVQSGAVWSDGTQPYLYMGIMNAYSKMAGDDMALASATGISGGAAFTIPSLFLPALHKQTNPFSRLTDPKLEKVENVGNEECYVISGSSAMSEKETFWISKSKYLLIRHSRSFEPSEGGRKMPEMTDESLEESIKAMGQEVTEENTQRMREVMKRTADSVKGMDIKGSSTETHTDISFPELTKDDFQFAVPEGTELKESLFGGVLGGIK